MDLASGGLKLGTERWKNKFLIIELKLTTYKVRVQPVIKYGAESPFYIPQKQGR